MPSMFKSESTSTQSLPPHITEASKAAIGKADAINAAGYVPYYGPDQAAFTGQQMAAMQGANQQANALGLPTAPMQLPTATDYGGGVVGYGSAGRMEQNLAALQEANPDLYAYIMSLKGDLPDPQAQAAQAQAQGANASQYPYQRPDGSGGSAGVSGGGGGGGGFGFGDFGGLIGDAFDGGGWGKSGDKFEGGAISSIGNALGGPSAFGRK